MHEIIALISKLLREHQLTLSIAESCTGGKLLSQFTQQAGASDYLQGGIVAYQNQIKEQVLGVAPELIREHSVVSRPVAEAMALGVSRLMGTDIALSTTGYAGPSGGTADTPIGTVCLGCYIRGKLYSKEIRLFGSRTTIQEEAIRLHLQYLLTLLERQDNLT